MVQTEQIEIPLSKKKIILLLLGSIVFVGLGVWFMIDPSNFIRPNSINPLFRSPTFFLIAGLASVLFFGLCAIVAFRKLFDKKVGLVINREGIIDNSSGVSSGLVLWSDIKEIKTCSVMSQKFLMLIVDNPHDYIDKISSPFKRKTVEMNYKTYGSPISISSNALQINFNNLHNLLTEKMKEYSYYLPPSFPTSAQGDLMLNKQL